MAGEKITLSVAVFSLWWGREKKLSVAVFSLWRGRKKLYRLRSSTYDGVGNNLIGCVLFLCQGRRQLYFSAACAKNWQCCDWVRVKIFKYNSNDTHILYFVTIFYLLLIYRENPTSNYVTLRKLFLGEYKQNIEDIVITTILWQYMSLLGIIMRRLLAPSISFIA